MRSGFRVPNDEIPLTWKPDLELSAPYLQLGVRSITIRAAVDVDKLPPAISATQRDHMYTALTETRPWGRWTVLEEGEGYKVKRIEVNSGQRLSLQRHAHRSEHWIVVAGTAKVSIGDRISFVHAQESTFVPVGAAHRIENPGPHLLIIIEIQSGLYLGEDDIVRLQDDYGRSGG
ncbi:MAG: phosphomannose isomerase type II C-terminal cupin domain [candidate division NC10 bacterium]|nr:phosphomannose isomerase type II C-terminal cupin domain [candidate division NC10 bacterium]MDE2320412.1 phosphomannose isomerase type II C-terminal cupin domain [candidate division NC10 bacterium]